jgi:N-methylhydantoinase A/oxoprolinase/acetone carboxylase beta subunit
MTSYLAGLERRLAKLGVRCPIEIMESSGGVMSASLAARRPIYTVESGGAAGVIAAGLIGELIGAEQVVSLDMGGTTAKAGVARQGRPDITHDSHVGGSASVGCFRPGSGYPVKIPVVDMSGVGSGGGSIASVDSGGALRVGPRSAGSVPGPACYGRGGTEPTVTDANLLLGYLRPGPLAGDISLDPALSEKAVQTAVGGPLGLAEIEALAVAELPPGEGAVHVDRSVDVRYRGQAHQLTVPAPGGPVTASTITAIGRAFAEHYHATYGITLDAPTEMVNFRVRLLRNVEKLSPLPHDPATEVLTPVPAGQSSVVICGTDAASCPVHRWAALEPGMQLERPAIVEGADTTVAVPPHCQVELDRWRNLILRSSRGA